VVDGIVVNDYLNKKGNLMRELQNMVLQIETDQIRIGGINAPAMMGRFGVPRESTWMTTPEPNPQQYYSAKRVGRWDYTRISATHLERAAK